MLVPSKIHSPIQITNIQSTLRLFKIFPEFELKSLNIIVWWRYNGNNFAQLDDIPQEFLVDYNLVWLLLTNEGWICLCTLKSFYLWQSRLMTQATRYLIQICPICQKEVKLSFDWSSHVLRLLQPHNHLLQIVQEAI